MRDDAGRQIIVSKPVSRIVSLSPHITELIYAAGAGHKLVGAVDFSDYPTEARELPSVGAFGALDYERIVSLRPDLVIIWQSGNPHSTQDQLEHLDLPYFISEPHSYQAIARNIRKIGKLAGTGEEAELAALKFEQTMLALEHRHAHRPKIRIFYQISDDPIFTLSGRHMIGRIIELCGGQNIFGQLEILAPQVSREAVLVADPEIILMSAQDSLSASWAKQWRRWPNLSAIKNGHLYTIHPDILHRQTPRIAIGAEKVCTLIEKARN